MRGMSLRGRRNEGRVAAKKFKLSLQTMTVWEREAMLQELSNEFLGTKQEIARLTRAKSVLKARMDLLRGVCKSKLRSTKTEEFVRYSVSTIVDSKSAPLGEPIDGNVWAIIDQHGRVAVKWWMYFKAGSTTTYRLKRRKDLHFQWSERKFMRTKDMPTMALLLREHKVELLHLAATFPARDKCKDVKTKDFNHFWFVRAVNGSTAETLPEIITRWGTYTGKRTGGAENLDGVSEVCVDSQSVQSDARGTDNTGSSGHILHRAAGSQQDAEEGVVTAGDRSSSKGCEIQGTKGTESSYGTGGGGDRPCQ